jgi:hypothetical protein
MSVRLLSRVLPPTLLMTFSLHGAQFLIVTRAAGRAWSITAMEAVLINGKDKVRTPAIAVNRPTTWDAKSVGHLPDVALSTFSAVRRSPDGNVWGRAAAGGEWILLLPDGIKLKATDSATAHWRAAMIMVRKERADKTTIAIREEELYAVLPGVDAAASAARLATELWRAQSCRQRRNSRP